MILLSQNTASFNSNMSLSAGKKYQIDNVDLNTDNIQESATPTNKYYSSVLAQADYEIYIQAEQQLIAAKLTSLTQVEI